MIPLQIQQWFSERLWKTEQVIVSADGQWEIPRPLGNALGVISYKITR